MNVDNIKSNFVIKDIFVEQFFNLINPAKDLIN